MTKEHVKDSLAIRVKLLFGIESRFVNSKSFFNYFYWNIFYLGQNFNVLILTQKYIVY